MPVFAALFLGLFTKLAAWFAGWWAKKTAYAAAAIATCALLTAGMFTAISALAATVVWSLPESSMVLTGLYLAIPSNTSAVLAFTIAVDTAVALYRWNMENLRLAAYVT